MNLLGAKLQPEIEGLAPLPGSANYFIGSEPNAWHTGIRAYGRVRYREIYSGIDLVYYGSEGQLEFDLIVRPGASPHSIRLHFEGAESLQVDEAGGLVLALGRSV